MQGNYFMEMLIPLSFVVNSSHSVNWLSSWYWILVLTLFFYLPQMNQSLLGSTNIFQLTWINLWPWPVMRLVTPNPRSGGGGLTARAPSVRPRPSPSLGSARKTLACISVRPALCMGLSLPRNLMSIFFSKVRPAKWYISIDFSPSHQEITLLLFKQAE